MEVSIINFSARKEGNCHQIAKWVQRHYASEHRVYLFEFGSFQPAPCGKCAYECFQNGANCPLQNDDIWNLYRTLAASDRVYFIIPNYCGYPCANFFIFNERCQGFFHSYPALEKPYVHMPKRSIVVSNTDAAQIREVLRGQVAESVTPDMLVLRSAAFGKKSVEGNLMDSVEARELVSAYLSREMDASC